MANNSPELETIIRTMQVAGAVATQRFQMARTFHTKENMTRVTELDLLLNKGIFQMISSSREFEGVPIISEEGFSGVPGGEADDSRPSQPDSTSRPYLLLDPLDGSHAASQGNNYCGIAIAFIRDGKPVLGAIYSLLDRRLYYAEKGKGAYVMEFGAAASTDFTSETLRFFDIYDGLVIPAVGTVNQVNYVQPEERVEMPNIMLFSPNRTRPLQYMIYGLQQEIPHKFFEVTSSTAVDHTRLLHQSIPSHPYSIDPVDLAIKLAFYPHDCAAGIIIAQEYGARVTNLLLEEIKFDPGKGRHDKGVIMTTGLGSLHDSIARKAFVMKEKLLAVFPKETHERLHTGLD